VPKSGLGTKPPATPCDGYTTAGGISSVDEEYAMIRRPRRAHSHSPRKTRRFAPSPSSRPKYSQRPMSPLARPTRSPPKRRLYENQWPTDFARVVLTRLFYSFSLSKALMFIFAVFKSIQVKSQRGCQSCGGFGETMTISVPWQDIVENFTNGISSIYFLCLLIFFFAFFNLS